jgi:hypothetical protein
VTFMNEREMPYDLCAEDVPGGMKRCSKCVRLIPLGHVLCDWCAAKHIKDQMEVSGE